MSRLHFDTTLETIRHARQDALEDYDMARRKYEEYLKKCDQFKNMVEIKQDHLRCLDAQAQQTIRKCSRAKVEAWIRTVSEPSRKHQCIVCKKHHCRAHILHTHDCFGKRRSRPSMPSPDCPLCVTGFPVLETRLPDESQL